MAMFSVDDVVKYLREHYKGKDIKLYISTVNEGYWIWNSTYDTHEKYTLRKFREIFDVPSDIKYYTDAMQRVDVSVFDIIKVV